METALARTPISYGTWAAFKAAFEKQFIPPATQMDALQKMLSTPMGNREFNEWFQQWSTYARRTQADENTKMWAFRKSLPGALLNKLLGLSPAPTTLDALVEKAREFDRTWRMYASAPTRGGSSRGRSSFRGRPQNSQIQEIKEDIIADIHATQARRGSFRGRG